jgi:hypothetical protein
MAARTLEDKQIKQIKRYRRKVLTAMVKDAYLLYRKGHFAEMNNLICDEFTKLGGVYVKFLQGVLLKSTLLRDWRSADKLRIFENLDSEPLDIQAILRVELSADKLSHIASVSPTPFAAGSFGQVYYANLKNGTPVIVKVLRPMIRETLSYDLKLIGWVMRAFINKIYRNMDLDILNAIDEFKRATMRETDYVEEAHFAHELWEAYKENTQFIIPETYLDLCTQNIIVQEYIDGISAAQLLRLKEQGVDPTEYVKQNLGSDLSKQLKTVGIEYIRGIFMLPRVQGDPHPGNVKLLSGNRVALIDFGISAKSPREKAAFYGVLREYERMLRGDIDIPMMLGQFLRFFVSDLYKAMKKITSLLPSTDVSNDLTRQMGLVAESNFEKEMGSEDLEALIKNGNILSTVNQVVNKGNRFGFVMKIDDSEMLRAAQSYITLVDALNLKTEVLPAAFKEGLAYVAKERPEYTQETESSMSVSRAMEVISKWLERVAIRDPALFRTFVQKINAASEVAKKSSKPASKVETKAETSNNNPDK